MGRVHCGVEVPSGSVLPTDRSDVRGGLDQPLNRQLLIMAAARGGTTGVIMRAS